MEFNFTSISPYSYIKYGGYSGKKQGKDTYLVPHPKSISNIMNHYDIFSKIDSALVDLLNVGRLCINDDSENLKFASALFFVEQYGLLGFMAEAPVNPNFMLDQEVILKEGNFINKNCSMKTEDYFKLFFPFASNEEMSYTISDNNVIINTNSDFQKLLRGSPINEQLIFSSFYCEKIDWIIEYAKTMYTIFKKIIDFSNYTTDSYEQLKANETIEKYRTSGVPYKINMYGQKPELCWEPNSLKQALDMSFGFIVCSEKNPLRICKHCNKVFIAKNPKAEYCSPQCRNQANVYKSRSKNN